MLNHVSKYWSFNRFIHSYKKHDHFKVHLVYKLHAAQNIFPIKMISKLGRTQSTAQQNMEQNGATIYMESITT